MKFTPHVNFALISNTKKENGFLANSEFFPQKPLSASKLWERCARLGLGHTRCSWGRHAYMSTQPETPQITHTTPHKYTHTHTL